MTLVKDVDQHPEILRRISQQCPNTIRLLESQHPIGRYTCLVHALDFTEKPEYLAIAKYPFRCAFAGPEFAHWLIGGGHLKELSAGSANRGDLILYLDNGQFKHAAIFLSDGRANSKWGVGHLFEHGILEVPSSYASEVRFFGRLPYDVAHGCFVDFARESGLLID